MGWKVDEKALRTLVQPALADLTSQYNRDFKALERQYRGKPISHIKPALARVFSKRGGKITEPELSTYAQMISDGVTIVLRS